MRLPTLLTRDPLTIYLNDHLAGASFGRELALRALRENSGNEIGDGLSDLAAEIDGDRRTLMALMRRLGVPQDVVKVTLGELAERVARLKPNGRLVGYSPLSRLLELEGLSGGVQVKLSLWRGLREAAAGDARLAAPELDLLIGRAESQLERLAALQARAAELVLLEGVAGT